VGTGRAEAVVARHRRDVGCSVPEGDSPTAEEAPPAVAVHAPSNSHIYSTVPSTVHGVQVCISSLSSLWGKGVHAMYGYVNNRIRSFRSLALASAVCVRLGQWHTYLTYHHVYITVSRLGECDSTVQYFVVCSCFTLAFKRSLEAKVPGFLSGFCPRCERIRMTNSRYFHQVR
jgi:hypothetical protein